MNSFSLNLKTLMNSVIDVTKINDIFFRSRLSISGITLSISPTLEPCIHNSFFPTLLL